VEMLAFAHIPTGNHNNKEIYIFDSKKGKHGAEPAPPHRGPAWRSSVQRAWRTGSKGGSGIFCQRELRAKNLPVPRRQGKRGGALLTGPPAAPLLSCAGSGRRDGTFRIEQRDCVRTIIPDLVLTQHCERDHNTM
jgi:hypothetical protein